MSNNNELLLSIIVVSYNTAELTKQTILSVFSSFLDQEKWSKQLEIIVVDNDSHDKSVATIQALTKQHSQVKLIKSSENLGFAKANNLAAKSANGKYLLLLNSDTIVQKGALEKLVSGAERNQLAIATPTLLNSDLSHQAQGGDLPSLLALVNHYWLFDDLPIIGQYLPSTQKTGVNFARLPQGAHDSVTRTTYIPFGWVGGTAMLFEKNWWEKIGGLDEEIFMYGEDIEICYRLQQLAGKIGQISEALIIHLGSASSSSKNALIGEIKSYLYFFKKHKSSWQLPLVKFIIKLGIVLRLVIFSTIKKNQTKVDAYWEAIQIL